MPQGFEESKLGVYAAGGPDGAFAVLFGYATKDASYSRVAVLLGNLGDPSVHVEVDPWPTDVAVENTVAWDGDAFRIHGHGSQAFELFLARVRVDGTEAQPSSKPGIYACGSDDGFQETVDAVTGQSWMGSVGCSGGLKGIWITAHTRDGSLIADQGDLTKPVMPQGFEESKLGSSRSPAVGIKDGGGAASWRDSGVGTWGVSFFQRLDPDLNPQGDAIVIGENPSNPYLNDYGLHARTLAPTSSG
jgi:hypothetical protein